MGLEVHCFAWSEGAICKDIADFYYPISIIEKEEILKICHKVGINGICTIASDVAAPTVAYVANKLGLVGNDYEAAIRANNKFLMREAFMKKEVPCPKYMMISHDSFNEESTKEDLLNLEYPIIVKPSDRSGSLGVTKVTNYLNLLDAIKYAMNLSFKHQVMIEEFIEGREISTEFISYNGVHYPLQITDKVTTGAPHFVELEHHQPSSLSNELFSTIYSITDRALSAIGITNGASHAEYKITKNGRIVIMEIGGRMGGDFIGSDLVMLSTGYDFLKGVIDVALGRFDTPIKTISKSSGVYFLCKETEYLKPIIEHWKDNPSFVKAEITDDELHSVKCSADRSGYVIYQTDNRKDIELRVK